MDNMLQLQILQFDTRGLFVPTSLQKLVIDVSEHINMLSSLDEENPEYPVYVYKEVCVCLQRYIFTYWYVFLFTKRYVYK